MSHGQYTVVEKMDDFDHPMLTITSSKFKQKFYVRKSNDGFAFYTVNVTKGNVPKALQGFFTKMSEAKKSVLKYIDNSSETPTVQRDKRYDTVSTESK